MPNRRSLIASAVWLSLLTSCAGTPDVLVCTEINPVRGWCTKTVSDEETFVDDAHPYKFSKDTPALTWWEMRPYMVLVPSPSWVELKSYIIKRCKQDGNCTEGVGNWERKIQDMDRKLKED